MCIVQEALAEYNRQRGTDYPTVAALGQVLAREALREAWTAKRRNEGHEKGAAEAGGF